MSTNQLGSQVPLAAWNLRVQKQQRSAPRLYSWSRCGDECAWFPQSDHGTRTYLVTMSDGGVRGREIIKVGSLAEP
ncbi:hypothetical protein JTE90_005652 [Oedothorax gibbosus]|uniref:Uncharacterized protein n=1 Tax=Oedothorax gibbosus TaxID=931172 RepID=A0AAV6UGG6_9ARAC|nr:hypothetical protein JTE90_005652 [Oedothorax gibbosus]